MGDQGIGDFTTLRLLAEEAAAVGAATVGLNPLHALFSSDPDRASPYHPSDRRFLDPLAIDAFSLPAPLLTARVRAAIAQAVPEASRLSAKPLVDYAAAAAFKNPLFDAAHAAFRDPRLCPIGRAANREIAIKSRVQPAAGGGGKLPVREPLQKHAFGNGVRMRRREGRDSFAL